MAEQTPPFWKRPSICAVAALLGGCAARPSQTPAPPPPEYTDPPGPPPIPVVVEHEPAPGSSSREPAGIGRPYATDRAVAQAVREELAELGSGSERSTPIDVTVERGVAMLTGNVPTALHARVAIERAGTVRGVRGIVDRIDVTPAAVSDAELESRVRARLLEAPALGGNTPSVAARRGTVHLRGAVHSYAEKELAADLALSVRGVRSVKNKLEVISKARSDREISADVVGRIAYDAYLSDDPIDVAVHNGTVALSGAVGTLMERRRAQTQAWVSGVRAVDVSGLVVAPARRDPEQRLMRPMPTDAQVEVAVRDALRLDPRVPEESIVARVQAGIVRLHGTVSSLLSKRAAERDAANTIGVWRVENLIEVSPRHPSTDTELVKKIRERLAENPDIALQRLSIEANAGRVTLRGEVGSHFEAAAIAQIAEAIPGVVALTNELQTGPFRPAVRDDATLEQDIERALWWDPRVDISHIDVEVQNGVATVTGKVPNRAIHEAVIENVWQAGPRRVDDRLERSPP